MTFLHQVPIFITWQWILCLNCVSSSCLLSQNVRKAPENLLTIRHMFMCAVVTVNAELFIFQSVGVRHWLSLSQRSLNLEDLTDLPVQPLDLVVTSTCPGSDRLQEEVWSGWHTSHLVVVLYTTLSLFRDGSPSPETTARNRCICRWIIWRMKTLLYIIVQESHSDKYNYSTVQNLKTTI